MTADTRNADLVFGAGDYLVYLAPEGTAKPTTFTSLDAAWRSMGWITTDGGDYKADTTTKDVTAAGSLSPIRTLTTGKTQTVAMVFDEVLNPFVRALYDDVEVASLAPAGGGSTIASYDNPNVPSNDKFAFFCVAIDGTKYLGRYGGHGMVTARDDEKTPTTDVDQLGMTVTFYPGPDDEPAVSTLIDYGDVDVSAYFS